MSEYIVTCDDEVALWIGNDVESMRPLVRCRDCKHFKQRDGILPPMVCERWGYYNFKTEPERFCALGERREQ